jgi:hypothetical protein
VKGTSLAFAVYFVGGLLATGPAAAKLNVIEEETFYDIADTTIGDLSDQIEKCGPVDNDTAKDHWGAGAEHPSPLHLRQRHDLGRALQARSVTAPASKVLR